VGRKPMIFHPIDKLLEAGIKEILIVTGVDHMGDVVSLLARERISVASSPTACRIRRAVSAQALGLARNFAHDDQMVVILADNIFADSIKPSSRISQTGTRREDSAQEGGTS